MENPTQTENEAVFAEIHKDIPREGPGNAESTRRAYRMLQLSSHPQILDIGCGPGLQTIELARLSDGQVTALDTHKGYLKELEHRASKADLSKKIKAVKGSMFSLPFPESSFDLIWSEGSIYLIGFQEGLAKWRPFLKDSGFIAVSHLSWLKEVIPDAPKLFWSKAFPQMTSVDDNIGILRESRYIEIGNFTLPESAWWDDYYTPLEKRLSELRRKYEGNAVAQEVIGMTQQEIDLYRNYSECYGYVFYVARKSR